jgi:hypothetical protein
MDQGLSLNWASERAASSGLAYRSAFQIAVATETLVGLSALVAPLWLASVASIGPAPTDAAEILANWIRAWACLLLLFVLIQLPAPFDAPRRRWLNVVVVAARLVLAVVYLLLGLTMLALLEAVLFLMLLLTLYRHMTAVLMSRP